MKKFNMIINGKQVKSGKVFDVVNPATGEAFAQYESATEENIDQAVDAARAAFSSWSKTSDQERKAKVMELAAKIESNMPELMELVTLENGKPLGGLNGIGSGMEVGGGNGLDSGNCWFGFAR